MLQQVLHEVRTAHGPLNLKELANRLGVEQSALEGMIDYWIRKGRLKEGYEQETLAGADTCSSTGCGGCGGTQGCPFVGKMPRMISLVASDERSLHNQRKG